MKLFRWFAENQIKANKDKCHLFISTNESNTINVYNNKIQKKEL